jgi:hypothetical protein
MGKLYRLKETHKLLTDFYVFDVETAYKKNGKLYWHLDATPESFIFGVIYGYNYTKVFHSLKELKEELLTERFRNRKVFAHNAQYDLNTVYGNLYDLDPETIFNGKFICCTNGNCTFADSMNVFIGSSVEGLGKMLGKEKLGMTRNYDYSEWPKDMAGDINGCIRDCEIVWDALFSSFTFAGSIKITQASLSMDYYKRYHMPFDIVYNENVEQFRNSYYGGRTEAFIQRKTHASVIDVNSMYPYIMSKIQYPNPKKLKHETAINGKGIDSRYFAVLLDKFEGCAKCDVYHRPAKFGYLPYKDKEKLVFPTGNFTGTWNFIELRFAITSGLIDIKKIHSITYGERMESPFKSFVDTLNEKKIRAQLEESLLEESIAKYYSNSLYGKFAQRVDENSVYIKDLDLCYNQVLEAQKNGTFVKLIPFNKDRNDFMMVLKAGKKSYIPHAIPSFASYITSGARIMLLDTMIKMHPKNNVVYCDTDSIFFEVVTPDIETGIALGQWKIEKKIVTEVRGLKNYKYIDLKKDEAKEIWRCKGVPVIKGRKVKIYTPDEVIEHDAIKQTGENTFEYWNLVKSKEALRRGIEPGKLIKRVKKISGVYDKRTVLSNGETETIVI